MRIKIGKPEWDKYFYHARQRFLQRKMKNEPLEKETAKVQFCLKELVDNGFLPHTNYSLDAFLAYRKLVHDNFYIIWTAINPPMEHLLYAISDILQPKNVLGLGVFTGNPVAWSLGPAIQQRYLPKKLVGVEIDPKHAIKGQENFDKISPNFKVPFLARDGFDVVKEYADNEIDMVYLDANGFDPATGKNGKNINYSFAKAAYSKLKPGGVLMCHNAYQPSFLREAAMFVEYTANEEYFEKTTTIAIDEMGLELAIKKA
jgi:predicted O-methyltransferase YrrM